MARQHRKRKVTADEKAKTYQDAMKRHDSPINLDARELKAFDALIDSREYSTWLDSDLNIAAKLAKVTVEMDKLWDDYQGGEEEAFGKWTKLVTPFQRMHNMLGISASQRAIKDKGAQLPRNQKQAAAKRKIASVENLLAKPK